jgi:plastocyanin
MLGCATAKPVAAPASPAVATPAAPRPAAGPVADRAEALREAASLLDKAAVAKDRGSRSLAEQLFSSAELIVGPEGLATIALLFREGAPPRVQTPLAQLPLTTPPQPVAAVGDSATDEPDPKPRRGVLRGVVKLDSQALQGVPAVITLEPADGKFHRRAPRHATMEQRNRDFAPHILTVPTGSTVTFPNFDTVYHNVFSRSEVAAFDLGIYRSGQSRDYTFDKDGIVHLGCNLHRNMSAYVVVVSQPHYVVTDDKGHFTFRSLEPGKYKARIWSERSLPITQDVVVAAGENALALDLHAHPADPGTDKFGVARGGAR